MLQELKKRCTPNKKCDTEQTRRRVKIRKEPMRKRRRRRRRRRKGDDEGDRRTRMYAKQKTRYGTGETEGKNKEGTDEKGEGAEKGCRRR